jgi:hypothetical protein
MTSLTSANAIGAVCWPAEAGEVALGNVDDPDRRAPSEHIL